MTSETVPPTPPSACPACRQPMTRLALPRKTFGTLTLDLCFPCQGIWLDSFEGEQITPGGIIELFRVIHEHRSDLRHPLPATLHCPRCNDRLAPGLDIARSGRFAYHRCLQKHGRFTVFAQFMIEKGFVRQLAPAEVKALAARIGSVHCTGCGAPVDIRTQPACTQCGAPIAILDPAAVDKALAGYQQAEHRRTHRDPEALADALLAAERQRRPKVHSLESAIESVDVGDMLLSGISLVSDLFSSSN